jgi:hypothetical protein
VLDEELRDQPTLQVTDELLAKVRARIERIIEFRSPAEKSSPQGVHRRAEDRGKSRVPPLPSFYGGGRIPADGLEKAVIDELLMTFTRRNRLEGVIQKSIARLEASRPRLADDVVGAAANLQQKKNPSNDTSGPSRPERCRRPPVRHASSS